MPLSDFHESMKGWKPVEASPTPAPQIPDPSIHPTPTLRAPLPLPLQYQPDTLRQSNRPNLSNFRIAPLPPSGVAALNSAIQGGATPAAVAAAFAGMTFRGVWNNFTAYSKNDVSLFNTSAYLAVKSNTNQEPDTNTTNWTLLSENLVFRGEWVSNGPTFVQVVGGVGGGTSGGVAVNKVLAPNTKGNVIIVYVVAVNGTLGTFTVSDSNGNSYTQLGGYVDNVGSLNRSGVFAAVNINPGANTVHITYSNNATGSVYWVAEYATASVSPVVSFQGSFLANNSNFVTLTTTDSSTVLLFYNAQGNLVAGSLTPPAGFVLEGGSLTNVGGVYNAYFSGVGTLGTNVYGISSTGVSGPPNSIEWGVALQTTAPVPSYYPSDVVEHLGSTYVCILATSSEPTATNTTHWYKLAQGVGYAAPLSGNYAPVLNDSGRLLVNSSSSAYTVTLPSPPPLAAWTIFVQNTGTGTTIISPNGLTLDGGSASLTLAQNQGVAIFTDGSNYFTERGFGTPSGGVNSQTISYTAILGDSGKLISMNGSSLTLTLPATPPNIKWWIAVENLNSTSLTVSRGGLYNIDGAASNLTLGQNQGVLIYTDGTNFFTERGTGPATLAKVTHKWLDSYTSTTGLFTQSQPAFADLSDVTAGTATIGVSEIDVTTIKLDATNKDVVLVRDAANTLALKNSTNPQTLRIYGTTTGPLYASLSSDATDGSLIFGVNLGTSKWSIDGTTFGLLATTDNSYDIGAAGATRPRTGYFGTSVLSPLFNAATGFQVAGAATSGHVLRGNGTNFVDAALAFADLSDATAGTATIGVAEIDVTTIKLDATNKDVILVRDAANTLALRNGVNPQLFKLYDTYTSGTNFESMEIGANAGGIGADIFGVITNQGSGGGTAERLYIGTTGNAGITLQTNNVKRIVLDATGMLTWVTDNTLDIGASGATRPRTGYFGTSIITPVGTFATSIQIAGATAITAQSGTGGTVAMTASPTFTGTIGAAAITATGIITAQGNFVAGVVGGTSGTLTLVGTTSGTATIVGPAVAGTVTNAITISNSVTLAASTVLGAPVINAGTGFQIAGAATLANVLRGDGTNFVSAQLAAADLSNSVTGSGAVVLASSPTIATPQITAPLTQSNAPISARALSTLGNSFEFGHSNQSGYGSVIGFSTNNGKPFIAFCGEAGSTANTFRSRGNTTRIIQSGTTGILSFDHVALANADNQTVVNDATLDTTGRFAVVGGIGVGGAAATNIGLYIHGTPFSGVSQSCIVSNGTAGSDCTVQYTDFTSNPLTTAAAFTVPDFYHFLCLNATVGAGSTITTHYGFAIASTFNAGGTNWGFYSPGAVNHQLGTGTTNIGTASIVTAVVPSAAGGINVGSAALPFSGIYIGGAATNNIRLTGTATGARTVTFPDANLNLSNAKANAGVPQLVAGPAKLTGQSAAISAALAFATGTSPGAGLYRLSYVATVTTIDAASSNLGGTNGFQVIFTNANGDSVVKTSNPTTPQVSAGNTTATTISGVVLGYAAASTNINYSFGYTSPSTTMRYDLAVYVEYLG